MLVFRHSFAQDDRALVDEVGAGLVKIVTNRRGRILGAHILGPRAGELIHEFVLAMTHGLTVRALADTIHVYPTLSMANQRAAAALLPVARGAAVSTPRPAAAVPAPSPPIAGGRLSGVSSSPSRVLPPRWAR